MCLHTPKKLVFLRLLQKKLKRLLWKFGIFGWGGGDNNWECSFISYISSLKLFKKLIYRLKSKQRSPEKVFQKEGKKIKNSKQRSPEKVFQKEGKKIKKISFFKCLGWGSTTIETAGTNTQKTYIWQHLLQTFDNFFCWVATFGWVNGRMIQMKGDCTILLS